MKHLWLVLVIAALAGCVAPDRPGAGDSDGTEHAASSGDHGAHDGTGGVASTGHGEGGEHGSGAHHGSTGDHEHQEGPGARASLPPCDGTELGTSPVAPELIASIVRLGNLNPPEHTLPTEHMYWRITEDTEARGGALLRAPGDIVVIAVTSNEDTGRGTRDFGLTYGVCDQLYGYFLHVSETTPELEAAADGGQCNTFEGAEGTYRHCWADASIAVAEGEPLGIVGRGGTRTFDVGMYDEGVELEFIDPGRYPGRSKHIVCPLERFADAASEPLWSKLEGDDGRWCGGVAFDVAGTLAGTWWSGAGDSTDPAAWGRQISLVPDNFESDRLAVSVGGTVGEAAHWAFLPEASGGVDLAFDAVSDPDAAVCYRAPAGTDALWARLVDRHEAEFQRGPSDCSGLPSDDGWVLFSR